MGEQLEPVNPAGKESIMKSGKPDMECQGQLVSMRDGLTRYPGQIFGTTDT